MIIEQLKQVLEPIVEPIDTIVEPIVKPIIEPIQVNIFDPINEKAIEPLITGKAEAKLRQVLEAKAVDGIIQSSNNLNNGLIAIGFKEEDARRLTNFIDNKSLNGIELLKASGKIVGDFVSPEVWEDFNGWFLQNIENIKDLGEQIANFTLEEIFNLGKLPRSLTEHERNIAKSVYGNSINLDLVRIDDFSIISEIVGKSKPRPFVSFYTINIVGSLNNATFIHELAHIWQFQTIGSDYMRQAIKGQKENPIPGDYPNGVKSNYKSGYGYGGHTELQARQDLGLGLRSFNLEQQATIIEHYFEIREDNSAANDIWIPLYSSFVQEASTLSLTNKDPFPIQGTDKNERIDGSEVKNVTFAIYAGGGNDTISGNAKNDYLDGESGDDELNGNEGSDTLFGEDGNDVLEGGKGNDYLDGGNGSSTVPGSGNDTLFGNEGNDTLFGEDGNDVLEGGKGDDELLGGLGDDFLIGDGGKDILDGQAGIDTVSYVSIQNSSNIGISIALDERFNDFGNFDGIDGLDQILNVENVIGSQYSDRIIGSSVANQISGENGNDIIEGLGGDDYLVGNAGDDELFGGMDADTLFAGEGNDTLHGNEGIDLLIGNAGEDELNGNEGNDFLNGGQDDDYLDGGTGNDELNGDGGNDTFINGSGEDTIDGGEGIDVISYETTENSSNIGISIALDGRYVGNFDGIDSLDQILNVENVVGSKYGDNIIGNEETNDIRGEEGNDILIGGEGFDNLFGGDGDDTLTGSNPDLFGSGFAEVDQLWGGAGADTFVIGDSSKHYYPKANHAWIRDFGSGDKILVHGNTSDYSFELDGSNVYLFYNDDVVARIDNALSLTVADALIVDI